VGKILLSYGGYTSTQIKNRSEVPTSSNIIVSGTTVLCNNVSMSQIATTLGISSGSTKLSSLSLSGNVNKWSNYSPYNFILSGSSLIGPIIAAPYSVGEFAGYDHTAIPCSITASTEGWYAYNTGMTAITASTAISLGQIDWFNYIPNLGSLNCEVKINGSIKGSGHTDLNNSNYLLTNPYNFNIPISLSGWVFQYDGPAFVRFYFGTVGTSYTEICNIPNVTGYTMGVAYKWYATGVQSSPCGGAMGQVYYTLETVANWNSISYFYTDMACTTKFIPISSGNIGYSDDNITTKYIAYISSSGGAMSGNTTCPTTTTTTAPPTTTTTTHAPVTYDIYLNTATSSVFTIYCFYKIGSGGSWVQNIFSSGNFVGCPSASYHALSLSIPYGSDVYVALRSSATQNITFGQSSSSCGSSTGYCGQSSPYTRVSMTASVTDYFTAAAGPTTC